MADQISRLEKRFAAIPVAVRKAANVSLMRSAVELQALMKQLTPIDTGALRDSIAITPGGQSTPAYSQPGGEMSVPENGVAVTAGNSEVRYPHLVEFGTTDAPAQPFFLAAWRLLKQRITRRTNRDLLKAAKDAR